MTPQINPTTQLLFNALGLILSVIPVTVAILSYFPLWLARDDSSILSGISLLLICVAFIPFFKHIKRFLRSPSAPLLWFFAFIIFLFLSKIADEITVISFVGFITNLIGALFFRIARRYCKEIRDEGHA